MSANTKRVLIIEDEVALAEIVEAYLHRDGFETSHQIDGNNILALVATGNFDIILRDRYFRSLHA